MAWRLAIGLLGVAACAGTTHAPIAATPAPSPPAVRAATPPAVPSRGEVTLAFFEPGGGGVLDAALHEVGDAEAHVRACYADARRSDPSIAGWLLVDVGVRRSGGPAVTKLRESSPLPAELTRCVTEALRGVAGKEEWSEVPEVAYVSLR